MRSFAYSRPLSIDDAIGAMEKHPDAKFLGGGTNLVDLMKMGVEKPSMLIDITSCL
jgi:xanthine dehydrogenase YagS FAD-binding subunit